MVDGEVHRFYYRRKQKLTSSIYYVLELPTAKAGCFLFDAFKVPIATNLYFLYFFGLGNIFFAYFWNSRENKMLVTVKKEVL